MAGAVLALLRSFGSYLTQRGPYQPTAFLGLALLLALAATCGGVVGIPTPNPLVSVLGPTSMALLCFTASSFYMAWGLEQKRAGTDGAGDFDVPDTTSDMGWLVDPLGQAQSLGVRAVVRAMTRSSGGKVLTEILQFAVGLGFAWLALTEGLQL